MSRLIAKPFRRLASVALVAVGALAIASVVGGNNGDNNATTQLASADDRGGERTASRGSARTEDFGQAVAPADADAQATTTTSTTAAPVVTTTAAPSTTLPPTTTTPPTTKAPAPKAASSGNTQSGGASYYSYKAGGCAHKTIPKGTVVTVTNVANGKTATCVVNDRGPFVAGRVIDLDITVFKQVASTSAGVFTARISW